MRSHRDAGDTGTDDAVPINHPFSGAGRLEQATMTIAAGPAAVGRPATYGG
jgi:hypothetical protein